MILLTLWFLNFALAAAIVVALFQKRRRNREEEKHEQNESGTGQADGRKSTEKGS
jgi:flagellar biosynthesis/type III secretory pathway M-ring protein FliF/YscJ